jgi:hypothetical protein
VELATVKYRPTFEICPSNADGCLIVVIWPKGPEEQLDGFSSVEAAQRWIKTMRQAGLLKVFTRPFRSRFYTINTAAYRDPSA